MKKYKILESWHNKCDNAEDELFAIFDHKEDAEETIVGYVRSMAASNSLGKDFRRPVGEETVCVWSGPDIDGSLIARAWIGTKDTHFLSSEYRREFIIKEAEPEWEFHYDEEYPDTAGRNFLGLLSNDENFLFWHAFADEEGQTETCHIYDSLAMQPENEICSYPWTAENDSVLLNALNNLKDPKDFCGESSPIRTLKFKAEQED